MRVLIMHRPKTIDELKCMNLNILEKIVMYNLN